MKAESRTNRNNVFYHVLVRMVIVRPEEHQSFRALQTPTIRNGKQKTIVGWPLSLS